MIKSYEDDEQVDDVSTEAQLAVSETRTNEGDRDSIEELAQNSLKFNLSWQMYSRTLDAQKEFEINLTDTLSERQL